MRYGYYPTSFIRSGFIKAFPMPGLYGTNGLYFDEFHLARLTKYELWGLENDQVLGELNWNIHEKGQEYGYKTGATPLFMIFTLKDEMDEGSLASFEKKLEWEVSRFCLSAWLVHNGRLYNPFDFISYGRNGDNNFRSIGLYGRAIYEIDDGYELNLDRALSIGNLARFLGVLVNEGYMSNSLWTALNLFKASNSYNPFVTHRALGLFSCLTILLGDNQNQIQELYSKSVAYDDAYENLIILRNEVVHGSRHDDPPLVTHLFSVVRSFLREAVYISFKNQGLEGSLADLMLNQSDEKHMIGDLNKLEAAFEYSYS